jgi:ABC-type uncharacterized transport system permease subunit
VQIRRQGVPLIGPVPTQAIQALPHLATVLLLAGSVGRAVAPKAIGQPYVKERWPEDETRRIQGRAVRV